VQILYKDDEYIAVYKESGLFVHPSKEDASVEVSLMKELRDHLGSYVFPIHRLDRPVSGIVIFGLTSDSVKKIQEIWHTDHVKKLYIGLTRGIFKEAGQFDFPLGNQNKSTKQEAITKYSPIHLYKSATLVEIEILTGRYHQIRRHFARQVDHLLGDRKYGKKKYNDHYLQEFELNRIFLHSHRFEFLHPTKKKWIKITSPLPTELVRTLHLLKKEHLETIGSSEYITEHYG
jgi:tRNA pseudouridine65 synthase